MKCLDTNAVIAVLNDSPAGARGRLAQELANGERIGIPAVALFELIFAFFQSPFLFPNLGCFVVVLAGQFFTLFPLC